MAKRGILEHEKTLMLADELEICEPFAVGLLEVFWQWVAKYKANGEVTGVRPGLMARAMRYPGDAAKLWDGLTVAGFIDALPDGRMLVHDWSEHADEIVHTSLARRCEAFADGTIPNSGRLNQHERQKFVTWLELVGIGRQPEVSQGSDQSQPEISHKSATSQPGVSQDSDKSPKPKPIPEPIPKPESKTPLVHGASADGPGEADPDALIYAEYPRKEGHRAALKQIQLAAVRLQRGEGSLPPMPPIDARRLLFRQTRAYARSPAGQNPDKSKIPMPKTWYSQSRYLDDAGAWSVVSGQSNGGSNGGNQRFRAKTDGNIDAAREAIAGILGDSADGSGAMPTGGGECGDLHGVCEASGAVPG